MPLSAAVRVNDSPIAVATAEEHKCPAEFTLLDELESIGGLKLARSTRRDASCERIVLQESTLTILIDGFCPRQQRGDAVSITQVRQQTFLIHRDLSCGVFHQSVRAGH